MASERTYGEILATHPAQPRNRDELADSRVRRPNQAGICGGKDGASYVDPDGVIRQAGTATDLGKLRVVAGHAVDWAQLAYHREHHEP
ncbi:hypothetical protein [Micromonospora sp. WMMA1976]|uniref:hypothetical protein n=1 Tax=Micromonospora sp. WMMA1976 TaxID=3014995 RepID=UPI00248C0365|nr:hypothetical protein [Micromonospora sp. WMMA1976]WBC01130.1 hypothetical protein O7546_18365 [Micromonospora sp. WMMA1976]